MPAVECEGIVHIAERTESPLFQQRLDESTATPRPHFRGDNNSEKTVLQGSRANTTQLLSVFVLTDESQRMEVNAYRQPLAQWTPAPGRLTVTSDE